MGSAAALEYYVLLAHDLTLIPDAEHEWFGQMAVDIRVMLRELIAEKKTSTSRPAAPVTRVQ